MMQTDTSTNPFALIIGICGKDGSSLAELLLNRGHEVQRLELV